MTMPMTLNITRVGSITIVLLPITLLICCISNSACRMDASHHNTGRHFFWNITALIAPVSLVPPHYILDDLLNVRYGLSRKFIQYTSEQLGIPVPQKLIALVDKYGESRTAYFPLEKAERDALLKVLPQEIKDLEYPTMEWQFVMADSLLIPHRDLGRICGINFYMRTNHETTKFYVDPTSEIRISFGPDDLVVYDEHHLSQVDSYIAAPGDVFILDISQIHAVEFPVAATESTMRVSLSLGFDHTNCSVIVQTLEEIQLQRSHRMKQTTRHQQPEDGATLDTDDRDSGTDTPEDNLDMNIDSSSGDGDHTSIINSDSRKGNRDAANHYHHIDL